ncbi:MAG TPA: hypothetical protein PK988_01850, partial [Candidatus Sumerlaeota bacterium]|nr:hypothetical protein [Candidatus Sumerlaeota bacterium]
HVEMNPDAMSFGQTICGFQKLPTGSKFAFRFEINALSSLLPTRGRGMLLTSQRGNSAHGQFDSDDGNEQGDDEVPPVR